MGNTILKYNLFMDLKYFNINYIFVLPISVFFFIHGYDIIIDTTDSVKLYPHSKKYEIH